MFFKVEKWVDKFPFSSIRKVFCDTTNISKKQPYSRSQEHLFRIIFFTFSSRTEYLKRESLRTQNKQQKMPVCLSVGLSGCLAVRTWILAVDTITFEGVSGSKQNFVDVFCVWNLGLVLKSKVKSGSWSSSWIGFWFWQKLCKMTPNLVGIFSI